MRVPVFVSTPSVLSRSQQAMKLVISNLLTENGLEQHTLGATDYPVTYPLKEVHAIARHCSGGVVLGFEQIRITAGVTKPDTDREATLGPSTSVPTPWNQLEAGILFGLNLPLLIFKEPGISGGIFDRGATDVFIHAMPSPTTTHVDEGLREVFRKWQTVVREHYYRDVR